MYNSRKSRNLGRICSNKFNLVYLLFLFLTAQTWVGKGFNYTPNYFASLPATVNGATIYCADCNPNTNPVSGSGTGTLLVGLDGVWVAYGPNGSSSLTFSSYTGPFSITGNRTNGTDSLNSVNINGIIDPRTYGAKGDGVTDDHTALQSALNACTKGGMIQFPANLRFVSSTALTYNGGNGCEISQAPSQEAVISNNTTTGIIFTAALSACSVGNGGLLQILPTTVGGVIKLKIHDIGLWTTHVGVPADCYINVNNAAYLDIGNVYFGVSQTSQIPTSTPNNMTGIYATNLVGTNFHDNVFEQGMAQGIYLSTFTANAFINSLQIKRNLFNIQPLAYSYLPQLQIESQSTGGSFGVRACNIEDNKFEVSPNNILLDTPYSCDVHGNWVGDGNGVTKWTSGASINPGGNVLACVTPTTYISGPSYHTFCVSSACTTGGSEPSWNTTAGSTTVDNTCTWYESGRGANFNLKMNGEVRDNHISSQGAESLYLVSQSPSYNGSATKVVGNYLFGGYWEGIDEQASAVSIENNMLVTNSGSPNYTGMIVISGSTGDVHIGQNIYSNGNGGTTTFISTGSNTDGILDFDSANHGGSCAGLSILGKWSIDDPGNTCGLIFGTFGPKQYTVGTLPATCVKGNVVEVTDATSLTVGTCTGNGSDATLAICSATNTWSCL